MNQKEGSKRLLNSTHNVVLLIKVTVGFGGGVVWGEGVFQISNDRDDGRIFGGLKFSIWGFFGV